LVESSNFFQQPPPLRSSFNHEELRGAQHFKGKQSMSIRNETQPNRVKRMLMIKEPLENIRRSIHIDISTDEERFIKAALDQAFLAAESGTYGIGAVVVDTKAKEIKGRGHNKMNDDNDPSFFIQHAEIDALRNYFVNNGRSVKDIVVYTTLEPCPMCTIALLNAGVKRVVAGASDRSGQLISHPNDISPYWKRIMQDVDHKLFVGQPAFGKACKDVFELSRTELDKILKS
jgi:tRNA(Arg) A34 adenosine deaminase TadA